LTFSKAIYIIIIERDEKEVTKMRKTEIREAIERLEGLKETIYESLNEMEDILREVAPEEFERAEVYWMAHIDGALENRGNWLGGRSIISYIDTIEALEEMAEMEEEMVEMEEEWED